MSCYRETPYETLKSLCETLKAELADKYVDMAVMRVPSSETDVGIKQY